MSKDFIDNPKDWETGDIAEYLEHIAGFIEDNDEMSFEPIEWNSTELKIVARLLYMGKIYE